MKQPNQIKIVAASLVLCVCLAMSLTSCKIQSRALFGGGVTVDQQTYCTYNPQGSTLLNCVGKYYGCFRMTNGSTYWLTAPTNVVSGTFTNLTFLGTNINWSLLVTERALGSTVWCTNNSSSLSFPAAYSTPIGTNALVNTYSFYLYINTLTNDTIILNDPITLEVVWTTSN